MFFVIFSIISIFATAMVVYFYDSLDTRSSADDGPVIGPAPQPIKDIPLDAPLTSPTTEDVDERFAW